MFPRRSQRRKILRLSKLLSKFMLMQLRIRVLGTQWKMLGCAHFAIYDGHGGRLAAEYAQKHLHVNVISAGLPRELLDVKAAKRAILDGFRKTDESLLQESSEGGWQDGATAVSVRVLGQKVFVANIGDAKAVLARSTISDGSQGNSDGAHALKAIVLTREHKPIFPQECARIQKVQNASMMIG
ncbi:probable protein phosphatase 2C 67 [Arachis stenosperma]|uniref:probable protein phosphatase 2C 67 n=1 Tax=Arachis stenosperma TaxID=217475 RepID=UPI0025AC90B0|nr:probable protein phosphatase 2C 67 [Arachis stenosperma]